MVAANKKNKNTKLLKETTVIFFLLLTACFFAGETHAAAPYANITACVQPPNPDTTNPLSPVIYYQVDSNSSNPVITHPAGTGFNIGYQVRISQNASFSPILYDTGEQNYGISYFYGIAWEDCAPLDVWCILGGRGGTPTTVSSHPSPRCGCDSDPDSANCPSTFSASAGDPSTCYDWWSQPATYSCGWDEYSGYYNCYCAYGGTCSSYSCHYDEYLGFVCTCADGSTPPPSCYWDEYAGYVCSVPGNSCSAPYAYQYPKSQQFVAKPAGTYSYTIPSGTLPINNSTYYYRVRLKDAYDWSPWVDGSFYLGKTDGACGTGLSFCDGTTIDATTPSLCSAGLLAITSSTNPWGWNCLGLNGGLNALGCNASVLSPPDCGTAPTVCEGGSLSCQPGMCTEGGTCTMTGATSWTFTHRWRRSTVVRR